MDDGNDGNDGRGEAERSASIELERLLVARGALSIEELAEAFAAECPELVAQLGAGDGDEAALVGLVTGIARHEDAFWRLGDGRLAPVLHHLRRATFTHRLTGGELAREAIDLCPDLVALALPRSVRLVDGTELRAVSSRDDDRASEDGSILGPDGWLDGFSAGDVVAVRYDGERAQLERVASSDLDEGAGRAVAEALHRAFEGLAGDRAPEVHRLVVDTIGAQPASFAVAVAPLRELLGDTDLGVREQWVGAADLAWATPPEQARRRRVDELLVKAEPCCRRAAHRALEAWLAWLVTTGGGGSPELDTEAAVALAGDVGHGPVAAVLADVAALGKPLVSVRRLGSWAGEIAAGAGTTVAAVEYLRAVGADASGDALAAEAHLNAGLGATPDHADCLGFLAELVADRGDARRSLSLLRQTGRPLSAEATRQLEPFLVDRNVGRNDPCPCGSGRKYKACCLRGTLQLPLVERCRWLLGRAARHATRMDPFAAPSLGQLFDMSGGGLPGASGADTAALVQDMLLFGDRGMARYLEGRGPLLAADELACARAWVRCPLRLVELETATEDGVVVAGDLRSGERLTISDPSLAASASVGDTSLLRPLPVGDRWILTGVVVQVPPGGRDRALAMLDGEVRPFQLLQLLVDLQVDALGVGGLAGLGLPNPG